MTPEINEALAEHKLWGADNQTGKRFNLSNLQGADLQGANLRGAYLRGANLRGALLDDNESNKRGIKGTP